MAVVLVNVYAGTFFHVNKLGPVINSLNELAHSQETQLVAQAGMDIIDRFLVYSLCLDANNIFIELKADSFL